MMDETNELDPDVRRRIDAHLSAIDRVLIAAGMSGSERRSIANDVEAQVLEMLSSRAGLSPTLADVEAVLAELDQPEAYAREAVVSPPSSAPPAPTTAPAKPHFSRLAILGAIWVGLFFATPIPVASLWLFGSASISSETTRGSVFALQERTVRITTGLTEPASTQPGDVSPDETTLEQLPATNKFVADTAILVASPPSTGDQSPEAGLSRPRTQSRISLRGIILFLPAILIMGAPAGATILGLVSISQIRRSAGRLYGLGLAVFDAIVFPLLMLDAAIFVLLCSLRGNLVLWVMILGAGLTCPFIDYLLVRWAWRSVNKPQPASG